MDAKALFDKHSIPDGDRKALGHYIATGEASEELKARCRANPNYKAFEDEALVALYKPLGDAIRLADEAIRRTK